MLTQEKIKQLFEELNEKLKTRGEIGEVGIIGGAVMCLVYQSRNATRDVDAIFKPADLIRKLSAEIGETHQLDANWLNDAAKGYLRDAFRKEDIMNLSNLRVWAPEAPYMLAMKCISARWDTHDRDDVIFLINYLKLKSSKQAFHIIENFYPKKLIPPKTQFFIEEIFSKN
ncbi:MAG TPA: DUF6036 family nucleotidyltransferase [Bdellovibrionota bacterium]|nr:DUF6036 family nucleotidyltransferase [Bdellovibrionota bacterium]